MTKTPESYYESTLKTLRAELQDSREENSELRKALRFYAEGGHIEYVDGHHAIVAEGGEKAKKVLDKYSDKTQVFPPDSGCLMTGRIAPEERERLGDTPTASEILFDEMEEDFRNE